MLCFTAREGEARRGREAGARHRWPGPLPRLSRLPSRQGVSYGSRNRPRFRTATTTRLRAARERAHSCPLLADRTALPPNSERIRMRRAEGQERQQASEGDLGSGVAARGQVLRWPCVCGSCAGPWAPRPHAGHPLVEGAPADAGTLLSGPPVRCQNKRQQGPLCVQTSLLSEPTRAPQGDRRPSDGQLHTACVTKVGTTGTGLRRHSGWCVRSDPLQCALSLATIFAESTSARWPSQNSSAPASDRFLKKWT